MKWAIALAAVLALAGGHLHAQMVTLDMEDVTLDEVIEEMKAQTGYDLRIMNRGGGMQLFEPRIDRVQATDRPLKEVLRQVCVWTEHKYRRVHGNLFYIEPGTFEASRAATMVAGYRISVDSVFVNEGGRSLDLVREYEGARLQPPGLRLTVTLEAPTDEAATAVGGFAGVRVVDDEGRVGTMDEQQERSMLQDSFQFHHLPDQTNVSLNFQDIGLRAKKLASLDGNLLLYEEIEELELRFDDLSARNVTVRQGDVSITLQEVQVQPGHVRVVRRIGDMPGYDRSHGRDPHWPDGALEVVFDDGTRESTRSSFYPGSSGSHGMGLRDRNKKPVAVVFRVTHRKGEPAKLPFRIEDIPLPN
jgi:hypothetical protein